MSAADVTRRQEEALDWVRRLHDPDFTDWDAHIAWLEADPGNPTAFDAAMLVMETATNGLAAPIVMPVAAFQTATAVNDNRAFADHPGKRQPAGRHFAWGGAIAAAFATIIAVPSLMHGRPQTYRIETAPGTTRELALLDGTTVALNGGSAIELDQSNPRVATVIHGEAFFRVVHNAADPFAVRAGNNLFRDVGTSFDVVRDAGGVKVAVREGAVMYDPDGAAVRIDGGQEIGIAEDGAKVVEIDSAAVGGWREGRLSYRDASLAAIASDLSRSLGIPVTVDPALGKQRFNGVLIIDNDRDRMLQRFAAVMDVRIRSEDNGWQMTPLAR
ncbi:FecR family protein [Sphingomonas oryzagri]